MAYWGVIKSFNPTKGFGFIECDETFQMHGKDMFVLKTALPGGTASAGEQVRFNVQEEYNGPVAKDVQPITSKGGGKGGRSSMNRTPGPPYAGISSTMQSSDFDPTYETSFVGTVKSFNDRTGWGMIESSLTMQLYGKDVFLSSKNLEGFSVSSGDKVRFVVKMEQKGPVAVFVQPLTQQRQLPVFAAPPSITPYYGGMQGGYLPPPPVSPPTSLPMHAFFGIVKGFNAEKGWGHITCNATQKLYNKDVFLSSRRLDQASVEPGMLVSFKVTMGAKGPEADQVTVLPQGSFSTDSTPGEPHSGTIKSYSAEKCWGFIAGDQLREIFGKDVFVNKRDLGEYVPSVGDEVSFIVAISEKDGQPYATNVTSTSGNSFKPKLSTKALRLTPY